MEMIIAGISSELGLEGTSLLAIFAVVSIVCRLIGKSIPDTATGVLGVVRRIAKILGLYVSNRITSEETTSSAAKKVVGYQ